MGPEDTESIQRQQFNIGDEVIGDGRIRGTIINTRDVSQAFLGTVNTFREYLVKSENGERFVYAGEENLQLIKKGLGDAAPPRPELLKELENDLRTRPLSGIRF
jgi:hypothetical protein